MQLRELLKNRLPVADVDHCHISRVQGLSGESWHIEGKSVQWLARQQTPEKQLLGVNRRREGKVLIRSGQKVGPRVVLQHPEWLLVEWLQGESVSSSTFANLVTQSELAMLIAELHTQALSGYQIDLQKQFSGYWQQIDRQRITPAWLGWQQKFMRSRMPHPLMLAPLHMDIHPGNLLQQQGQMRLIDWEYAADGDIALELAAFFRANQLSQPIQQHFLKQYSQHGYGDLLRLNLQVQRWLPWVDYLMLMWCEVRWQQCRDPALLRWGRGLYQRFCQII